MAGQPLSPATDRRLGGPLPHQLANQTRGHLRAINLWHKDHATSMRYAVLAVVSNCCPPLKGRFLTRYSPVRHFPLDQLDESSITRFSFDLHVLSTPPAFILSQDQTLNKMVSTQVFRLELIDFIEAIHLLQRIVLRAFPNNCLLERTSVLFWCFVFLYVV